MRSKKAYLFSTVNEQCHVRSNLTRKAMGKNEKMEGKKEGKGKGEWKGKGKKDV